MLYIGHPRSVYKTNLFKSVDMLYDRNALETLMVQPDEMLLQQMAAGDKTAFTVLYRRYWEELFVIAVKVLGNKEEAADVVQDIFLSFWNRRDELTLQASLAAYLHTSVRYKCIHYMEKNNTRRDYLFLLASPDTNTSAASADTNLDLKEIHHIVGQAIAKMPPKMQEVYKLSREKHLSHKEIAEYLNVSSETVKKHIQHALHIIRQDLRKVFAFDALILCCLCY